MRSAEAASVAGVTVRTLRHYHRVGLLPEPQRSVNGYRLYEWWHVARLFRIRALTSAGVPLARIPALLSRRDPQALDDRAELVGNGELAEVERDLSDRIEQLVTQRELIRAMRGTARGSSTVPVRLARALDRVWFDVPTAWRRFDKDLALMLHLSAGSPGERDRLGEVYEAITAPERIEGLRAVVSAFEALRDDASGEDIQAVVGAAEVLSAGIRTDTPPRLAGLSLQAARLVIAAGPFTAPQREVLRRLLQHALRAET